MRSRPRLAGIVFCLLCLPALATGQVREAFFGDLHVHTRFSFDAFLSGTRATPDDAYRYALGEALPHAAGFEIQLDRPLDFTAVTDHANYLGMLDAMSDPNHPLSRLPEAPRYMNARTAEERFAAFRTADYIGEHLDRDVIRSAWRKSIESAERYYKPGTLTTFIAYEYTSGYGGNLHRNVIFKGSAAPEILFSRLDSMNPEGLWEWMDELRDQGIEALAIPHNSNSSNGHMFALETFDGEAFDAAYAERRMRNEPLVEVTQAKGTSDTHPVLSRNDEWADFEIYPYRTAVWSKSQPWGSYAREAYLNGLLMEDRSGFNPYRFGLIGSSDTHNGGGSFDESNFYSKVGVLDGTAQIRGSIPTTGSGPFAAYTEIFTRFFGASGLAGVWAEENNRESIYEAFRRKETFATSGPRMRVRLFAGYDYPDGLAARADASEVAYARGVPMGGDVLGRGDAEPDFLVWATKDPLGTPLQRLQIVKGWVQDGVASERVYDVACSDDLEVDEATHRCPDNGATVDLSDCSRSEGLGSAQLATLWRDPNFDASQRAFYYVRVLENPTCRWSTWDAVRAGVEPRPDLAATIQERAWSSPIWYLPGR